MQDTTIAGNNKGPEVESSMSFESQEDLHV